MFKEPEDPESEIIRQMFDEIMKMIREKQIKLESIVQRAMENEAMKQETFDRIYRMLTDYGKSKQWIST
jgi:proline dehydrogenase